MPSVVARPIQGMVWIERRLERRAGLWRWILAGPLAFFLAILSMAALPMVLPAGPGGVDNFVLPVIFFPLIWSVFIVLPVAAKAVGRMAILYAALLAGSATVIALAFAK